jgi:hypothetical protein
MAIRQQSKVENNPPHTAKEPPNRLAFAFTPSMAPANRSPLGAFRAPLTKWKMEPPTCYIGMLNQGLQKIRCIPSAPARCTCRWRATCDLQIEQLQGLIRCSEQKSAILTAPNAKAPPRSLMIRCGQGSRSCGSMLLLQKPWQNLRSPSNRFPRFLVHRLESLGLYKKEKRKKTPWLAFLILHALLTKLSYKCMRGMLIPHL